MAKKGYIYYQISTMNVGVIWDRKAYLKSADTLLIGDLQTNLAEYFQKDL